MSDALNFFRDFATIDLLHTKEIHAKLEIPMMHLVTTLHMMTKMIYKKSMMITLWPESL